MPRNFLTFALLLALPLGAAAQDSTGWPKPAEGWWKTVKAGTLAVYEFKRGEQVFRQKIEVEEVDLEKGTIRVSSQTFTAEGKEHEPADTRTLDVTNDEMLTGALPPNAVCKKLREETLKVKDRELACTVYEVTVGDMKLTAWYSAELPPVFSGGNAKLEREVDGMPSTITLVEYTPGKGE